MSFEGVERSIERAGNGIGELAKEGKEANEEIQKMSHNIQDVEKTLTGDIAGLQKQMTQAIELMERMAATAESQLENLETKSEKELRKVGGVLVAAAGAVLYWNSDDPVFKTAGGLTALIGISLIAN